ncbi:MAG: helix-turn-helix domain-containing protein, partial [Candidatus Omnitrophota bacterium]
DGVYIGPIRDSRSINIISSWENILQVVEQQLNLVVLKHGGMVGAIYDRAKISLIRKQEANSYDWHNYYKKQMLVSAGIVVAGFDKNNTDKFRQFVSFNRNVHAFLTGPRALSTGVDYKTNPVRIMPDIFTVFARLSQREELHHKVVGKYFDARSNNLSIEDEGSFRKNGDFYSALSAWYHKEFYKKESFAIFTVAPSHHEADYFRMSSGLACQAQLDSIKEIARELAREQALEDIKDGGAGGKHEELSARPGKHFNRMQKKIIRLLFFSDPLKYQGDSGVVKFAVEYNIRAEALYKILGINDNRDKKTVVSKKFNFLKSMVAAQKEKYRGNQGLFLLSLETGISSGSLYLIFWPEHNELQWFINLGPESGEANTPAVAGGLIPSRVPSINDGGNVYLVNRAGVRKTMLYKVMMVIAGGDTGRRAIAQALSISESTVKYQIRQLKELGIVRVTGRKYSLIGPSEGRDLLETLISKRKERGEIKLEEDILENIKQINETAGSSSIVDVRDLLKDRGISIDRDLLSRKFKAAIDTKGAVSDDEVKWAVLSSGKKYAKAVRLLRDVKKKNIDRSTLKKHSERIAAQDKDYSQQLAKPGAETMAIALAKNKGKIVPAARMLKEEGRPIRRNAPEWIKAKADYASMRDAWDSIGEESRAVLAVAAYNAQGSFSALDLTRFGLLPRVILRRKENFSFFYILSRDFEVRNVAGIKRTAPGRYMVEDVFKEFIRARVPGDPLDTQIRDPGQFKNKARKTFRIEEKAHGAQIDLSREYFRKHYPLLMDYFEYYQETGAIRGTWKEFVLSVFPEAEKFKNIFQGKKYSVVDVVLSILDTKMRESKVTYEERDKIDGLLQGISVIAVRPYFSGTKTNYFNGKIAFISGLNRAGDLRKYVEKHRAGIESVARADGGNADREALEQMARWLKAVDV